MASWNEIKAKICKTTDKVVAKTSEVADTAAKHVRMKTIDGKVAEKYEELGRVYYVVLKGEEVEEGKAQAIVAEIEALVAEKKVIKAELEAEKQRREEAKKAKEAADAAADAATAEEPEAAEETDEETEE
ncbi:MAG: hypothetical protein J6M03_06875 [Clostridia bacterium]|nr:hypothetical protein [Clostridia bacterium]